MFNIFPNKKITKNNELIKGMESTRLRILTLINEFAKQAKAIETSKTVVEKFTAYQAFVNLAVELEQQKSTLEMQVSQVEDIADHTRFDASVKQMLSVARNLKTRLNNDKFGNIEAFPNVYAIQSGIHCVTPTDKIPYHTMVHYLYGMSDIKNDAEYAREAVLKTEANRVIGALLAEIAKHIETYKATADEPLSQTIAQQLDKLQHIFGILKSAEFSEKEQQLKVLTNDFTEQQRLVNEKAEAKSRFISMLNKFAELQQKVISYDCAKDDAKAELAISIKKWIDELQLEGLQLQKSGLVDKTLLIELQTRVYLLKSSFQHAQHNNPSVSVVAQYSLFNDKNKMRHMKRQEVGHRHIHQRTAAVAA